MLIVIRLPLKVYILIAKSDGAQRHHTFFLNQSQAKSSVESSQTQCQFSHILTSKIVTYYRDL